MPSVDPASDPTNSTTLLECFDQVAGRFPARCFFVDRFPLQIRSNEIYRQLAIFYDAARRGDVPKWEYEREEDRFRRTVARLWAYSPVTVQSTLPYENLAAAATALKGQQTTRLKALAKDLAASENGLLSLNTWRDLNILLKLGLRERAHSVLVFHSSKIMMWTSQDLVIPVYCGSLEWRQHLQQICLTEGLYLRPMLEESTLGGRQN